MAQTDMGAMHLALEATRDELETMLAAPDYRSWRDRERYLELCAYESLLLASVRRDQRVSGASG